MAILAHYSRKQEDNTDWDTEDGVVYHVGNEDGTATFCGCTSDASTQDISDLGWRFFGQHASFAVTCKRCLRILQEEQDQHKIDIQLRQIERHSERENWP